MSDVDNTVSRASDAGADSWADSEEDSDMGAVHGKKVHIEQYCLLKDIFHIRTSVPRS